MDVWLDLSMQWVAIDSATVLANWAKIDLVIQVDDLEVPNPKQYTTAPTAYHMKCLNDAGYDGQMIGVTLFIPPLSPGVHEIVWTHTFTDEINDGWSIIPKGTVAKAISRLTIGAPAVTLAQAHALLQQVGLDTIITPQDDPILWATALVRYQKEARQPDYYPAGLEFGVGRRPTTQEQAAGSSGLYGLLDLSRVIFEKDYATGKISVKPYDPSTSSALPLASLLSMSELMANPFDPARPLPKLNLAPSVFLHLTRPSVGVDDAWVHDGFQAGPLAGRGQTVVWKHLPDGRWVETSQIIDAWIS